MIWGVSHLRIHAPPTEPPAHSHLPSSPHQTRMTAPFPQEPHPRMTPSTTRRLALLALSLSPMTALANEGMWMPGQTKEIGAALKADGLQLDPAALGDLKAAPLNAIVSLGGCSAAFLSPEGLVATNHHCVLGSVQYNSKAGQDYLTNGFLAAALTDELPAAPGSRIYVIEDP